MRQTGLMHIYCGEGKGKTTAAFGLALRAAGQGLRVVIVQFLKGAPTGEAAAVGRLEEITLLRGADSEKFVFQMTPEAIRAVRDRQGEVLRRAEDLMSAGECDLLILDELLGAWGTETVDREQVLRLIDNRPAHVELVLTGRDPDRRLLERADYVTEMTKVRHPYDRGVSGRRGIEW